MKLAIAFVAAALSLAACAEEPTNLGGAHGIGSVKGVNDNVDIDSPTGTTNLEGSWIENMSLDKLKEACAACSDDTVKLHYIKDGVEMVDLVTSDLELVCHFSYGNHHLPCDITEK